LLVAVAIAWLSLFCVAAGLPGTGVVFVAVMVVVVVLLPSRLLLSWFVSLVVCFPVVVAAIGRYWYCWLQSFVSVCHCQR